MKNSRSATFVKYGFILAIVCLFSAGSLTFVYVKTKSVIEDARAARIMRLQREIFPEGETFKDDEPSENVKRFYDKRGRYIGEVINVKRAYDKNGQYIGNIVSVKSRGHGDIDMRVGVSSDNAVLSVKIFRHRETPGLGTKALTADFLSQFVQKRAEELFLTRDDKNGSIEAITGATITSRAVTTGVRIAIKDDKPEAMNTVLP